MDLPARPNIVFLCTDDQAQWAMGAYGNRDIKTPNLDRLARRGAIFRNAFTVTPVCSPSRAALMTSRYPASWASPTGSILSKEPDLGLAPAAITWPELLKGFGYATMLAGKWHLGTRDEFHPTRQGFDVFFGFRDGSNRPIDPPLEVDGQVRQLKGSLPDLLVDAGMKFVEAIATGRSCCRSTSARRIRRMGPCPSRIRPPTARSTRRFPTSPAFPRDRVKQIYREYYASVSSVDRNVGRLLAKLDELGLSLTNGRDLHQRPRLHDRPAWPLAQRQRRVAGRGEDGRPAQHVRRRDPRAAPDVLARSDRAGDDDRARRFEPRLVPDNPGDGRAGRAREPRHPRTEPRSAACVASTRPWDDTLFGQYDMHHSAVARMRMIRTPEWKLVRHFEPGGQDELYHLAEDPGETRNLADSAKPEHRSHA